MIKDSKKTSTSKKPTRVPGRRSSKPLMEKKRRARINHCLDILKSYVLKETTENLKTSTTTNEIEAIDENNTESIEQLLISELKNNKKSILKNSNLANKGRRNPNKLEKADILELTVDHVRRLHEERDRLQQENLHKSQDAHQQISKRVKQQHNNVSLTLQIEQLIRIPAIPSPRQTPETTTDYNVLQNTTNSLSPLLMATSGQAPPSPPSSASSSPLPGYHNLISSTTFDHYEQPLSMVVCDNSRLRERQSKPWRPWDQSNYY